MMDLVFFAKTLCVTLVLILLLQMKVGSNTLENHAVALFHDSAVSQPLGLVAQGGAKIVRELVHFVHQKVNSKFGSKDPNNQKSSGFRFSWESKDPKN